MTFSISTKIQVGSQNLVPKINVFLLFYTEIQDGRQKWRESDFCEKPPVEILSKSLYLEWFAR